MPPGKRLADEDRVLPQKAGSLCPHELHLANDLIGAGVDPEDLGDFARAVVDDRASDHRRSDRSLFPEKGERRESGHRNAADARHDEVAVPGDRGRRLPERDRDAPVGVMDRGHGSDPDRDAEHRKNDASRMPARRSDHERAREKSNGLHAWGVPHAPAISDLI